MLVHILLRVRFLRLVLVLLGWAVGSVGGLGWAMPASRSPTAITGRWLCSTCTGAERAARCRSGENSVPNLGRFGTEALSGLRGSKGRPPIEWDNAIRDRSAVPFPTTFLKIARSLFLQGPAYATRTWRFRSLSLSFLFSLTFIWKVISSLEGIVNFCETLIRLLGFLDGRGILKEKFSTAIGLNKWRRKI